MSKSPFAQGIAPAPTTPDIATDPSGAEAELFAWNNSRALMRLVNDESSPATMYLKWNVNKDAPVHASPTDFHEVIPPGGSLSNGRKFDVEAVSIYFTAAAVQGTHFTIWGI